MLDKSIEYRSVILMCENKIKPQEYSLPEGYSYRFYQDGDEFYWAEIELSVLELDNIEQGIQHVKNAYIPDYEGIRKRMIFIVDKKNIPCATATAWYSVLDGNRIGVVHAVGVKPEYQGKKLGMAIVNKMMQVFYELDPNVPVWMDTQTWSYKAIGCYLKNGFKPYHFKTYNEVPNQYDDAIKILKGHMRDAVLNKFIALTVEE